MSEAGRPDRGPAALLINARSRRGDRAEAVVATALRRRGLELARVERVRRPDHLGRAVREILHEGVGRLIVGGGDGTMSAVAPHLAGAGPPVLLGVIPLGTANDFARTLGLPLGDPEAAAEVAAGDHVRPIDLARANDAYFLNVASVGLPVATTERVSPRLKRWLGPLAYAVAAARAFVWHPPFQARLIAPDGARDVLAHQVIVGNGRFYGGGVLVSDASAPDDGTLVVYTLGARSRWQLLRTVALLRLGIPLERPGDVHFLAPHLRLELDSPRKVNLDGELRTATPVEFAVVPAALRVLTPAPGAGAGLRSTGGSG